MEYFFSNIKSEKNHKRIAQINYRDKQYESKIILFFIAQIILNCISFSLAFGNLKLISKFSEITYKTNGTGEQLILGESYNFSIIDQIYINDIEIQLPSTGMINLTSNETTIKLIINSDITDCRQLFRNLKYMTEIDLTKLDTSKVTDMGYMFLYCSSLTSLNLSTFDTSKVINMNGMFWDCSSLSILDVSNFNTTLVNETLMMFTGCKSLTYLNLSNFNTNNFGKAQSMFSGCESLSSLDFHNFNIDKIDVMSNMFFGCRNLEYINMANSPYSTKLDITGTAENIVICINNISPDVKQSINSKGCAIIDCSDNWRQNQKIVIADDGTCVNNCIDLAENKYLYLNKCYKKCPNGATGIDNYFCEFTIETTSVITTTTTTESLVKISNTSIITTSTTTESLVKISNSDISHNNTDCYLYKSNSDIYNMIINEIIPNYDIEQGENQIIEGNDVIFQVTTQKNELNTKKGEIENPYNLSMIDLAYCNDLLKDKYDINDNMSLIILKTENVDKKAFERNVQYEIYNPLNKSKLDLSICKTADINLFIPTQLSEKTKIIRDDLKKSNFDIFNKNDPFYNDICTPYTTLNKTDIILYDRKIFYLNNNDTICQSNCEFANYSDDKEYLECICNVINEDIEPENKIKFNAKKIYQSFYEVLKYSNYEIVKCYKLIFDINIFKSNKGTIVVLVLFSFYFCFLVVAIFKGVSPLRKQISNKPFKKNNSFKKNNLNKEDKPKRKSCRLKAKYNSSKYKAKNKKYNVPPKKKNKSKSQINKRLNKSNLNTINNYFSINSNNIIYNVKSNSNSRMGLKPKNKNKIINKNRKKSLLNLFNNNTKSISIYENKTKLKKETKLANFELNNLEYKEALIYDKRNFCQTYISIIRREHIIIFTFFEWNDYNLFYIKLSKFFFLVCTDMAMNVFFFSDESMHKIFLSYGKYDFIQQIPQIIYSTIISNLIELFLCYLTMTDKHFYEMKKKKNMTKEQINRIFCCIKIKLIIFYVFSIIFFAFYFYIITGFCSIYKNTQIIYIKDSIFSFVIELLIPFPLYLFPCIIRIIALKSVKKNLKYLYKLSDIIPFF